MILAEDVEHLGPMYIHIELRGVGACGQSDIETVVVTAYVKQMYISRIGSKCAVEVAYDVVHTVYVAVQTRTRVEQRNLILEAELLVDAVYLLGLQTLAMNGIAACDNLLHTLAQSLNLLVGDGLVVVKLAVETASQRVADIEFAVVVEVPHRLVQNKRDCALIYAITLKMGNIDKTHHRRLE